MYWKSRNARPTRRYEETILTPPNSPERPQPSSNRPVVKEASPKQACHTPIQQFSPDIPRENGVSSKTQSPASSGSGNSLASSFQI